MKKIRFPVFWTVYAVFMITGVVLVRIGCGQINVLLSEYEASQPKYEAERVFNENFKAFDAASYLEKIDDDVFGNETKENVARYLSEKTEGKQLSYYSVSSDSEDTVTYSVKAGEVKIAAFQLRRVNGEGQRFPSYEADSFQVYFPLNESTRVTVPAGAQVLLNGKPVSRDNIEKENIPHEDNCYLCDEAEKVFLESYYVSGFVIEPELKVIHKGQELTCFEGESGYECERIYSRELSRQHSKYALDAMKVYAKYIQGKYSEGAVRLPDVLKYFDPDSALYESVKLVSNQWVKSFDSCAFEEESASEFISYGEDVFSCRVSFRQILRREGMEDYTDSIDYTLYFRRVEDEFLIYEMKKN